MITDPRTIPASDGGRRVYAVSVGFLAALLIAPWTTEFAHKVAVLGALAIVCAARPLLAARLPRRRAERARRLGARDGRRAARAGVAALAVAAAGALLVLAGLPARPEAALAAPRRHGSRAAGHRRSPRRAWHRSTGGPRGGSHATSSTDLEVAAEALRTRNRARASRGGDGSVARRPLEQDRRVPRRRRRRPGLRRRPRPAPAASPARARARRSSSRRCPGTTRTTTYGASASGPCARGEPGARSDRTFEIVERGGRYLVVGGSRCARRGGARPVRAGARSR